MNTKSNRLLALTGALMVTLAGMCAVAIGPVPNAAVFASPLA